MIIDPHAIVFNLLSEDFRDNPAATFAQLRGQCPVNHTMIPAEHWTLSSEADVTAALRDDETWSSKYGPGLSFGVIGSGVLVSSDPPMPRSAPVAHRSFGGTRSSARPYAEHPTGWNPH